MKRLAALIALLLLAGARDPILVPEVSQHEIQVSQGFTGTELLLFGAILDPGGTRAGRDYDIVVILKGPTQAITLREKEKIGGIWFNAHSTAFRSAPSYYAVASSRPIKNIVDARTAAIYELGLDRLQLSPVGEIDPVEQARFSAGLVDLRKRQGLYKQEDGAVKVSEQVLYQARLSLPSNVQTGTYTAETLAITKGRVIASATAKVEVQKFGFGRFVVLFAENRALAYGLVTVVLSVAMGWIAGRLFVLI